MNPRDTFHIQHKSAYKKESRHILRKKSRKIGKNFEGHHHFSSHSHVLVPFLYHPIAWFFTSLRVYMTTSCKNAKAPNFLSHGVVPVARVPWQRIGLQKSGAPLEIWMKPNGKKNVKKVWDLEFNTGFQMQKRLFPQSLVTYKNHIEWKHKKCSIYLSI